MQGKPGREAVPLRDDQIGVSTESRTRKIQNHNGEYESYHISLNPAWLDQLGLAKQGEATVQSFSAGISPVIVQYPAIIVQPASVLTYD